MKNYLFILLVISAFLLAGCDEIEEARNNIIPEVKESINKIVNESEYENLLDSFENTYMNGNSGYTNEQLVEMVKKYLESKGSYVNEHIEVEDKNGNTVTIHLYDIVDNHTATSDWYYIDCTTGVGENLLGEKIDLNVSK